MNGIAVKRYLANTEVKKTSQTLRCPANVLRHPPNCPQFRSPPQKRPGGSLGRLPEIKIPISQRLLHFQQCFRFSKPFTALGEGLVGARGEFSRRELPEQALPNWSLETSEEKPQDRDELMDEAGVFGLH